ncbi:MAG: iron ABC transporter substrate-binding protein [Methanosarcinaceae archaeon]|nr:iron ABC transporter substrate-binding protein [Methanosarcinaceae archaeon]
MDKNKLSILLIVLLLIITSISGCVDQNEQSVVEQTGAVQITDMLGRDLTVPLEIDNVVATSPPSTILIYMLEPEKLAGWNFVNSFNHTLMNETYLSLPVIGGWFGTQTGNYETIINIHPDIVLEGFTTDGQINDAIQCRQEMFGSIPVVAINSSIIYVEDSDPTIKYVGELLGCEEQSESLIDFRASILDEIHSKVSDIPDEDKVRVYYAEGPKGLMTDPSGSQHSQVINICGGINVADCPLSPGSGMTPVSIEQVMEWDPEVILTSNAQFYESVYFDSLWESMTAVKNKRVYLAPQNPFCWIDRPQGPHLIVGTAWTATVLYPELFEDLDMEQITREFYSQFLHYELIDEELDMLLNPSTGA